MSDNDVVVQGKVKVEWDELGEGQSGEYNPDDPDDVELLRFTVYAFNGDAAMLSHANEDQEFADMLAVEGLGWQAVDDASYCTQVPVAVNPTERRRLLMVLMAAVHDRVAAGQSIKKDCEALSWIAPGDGTDSMDDRFHGYYPRHLGEKDKEQA